MYFSLRPASTSPSSNRGLSSPSLNKIATLEWTWTLNHVARTTPLSVPPVEYMGYRLISAE